jgi:hypothetical protein
MLRMLSLAEATATPAFRQTCPTLRPARPAQPTLRQDSAPPLCYAPHAVSTPSSSSEIPPQTA